MKHSITILNGKKHMHRNARRGGLLPRLNPDGSLPARAGGAVVAAAIAAPFAIIVDRIAGGMKRADGTARYSENQTAALVAGIGVAVGSALQINNIAPMTGVAVGSACAALAGARVVRGRALRDALASIGVRTDMQSGVTPDAEFVLRITPSSARVTPGTEAVTQVYSVTAALRAPATRLSAPVALAVTGLTAGITATLSTQSIGVGDTATLTLTVPAGASPGAVRFQVVGTNSATSRSSVDGALSIGPVQPTGLPAGFVERAGAAYPSLYGQTETTPGAVAPSGAAPVAFGGQRPSGPPAPRGGLSRRSPPAAANSAVPALSMPTDIAENLEALQAALEAPAPSRAESPIGRAFQSAPRGETPTETRNRERREAIDRIRQERREAFGSNECLCADAPGGARVMARRR